MIDFNPQDTIETERLLLRFVDVKDTHDIFTNINSDKEVLTYFIDRYLENEDDLHLEKRVKIYLEDERYDFSIVLKETGEVIGTILQCSASSSMFNFSEVGYAIGKKHWNKGYTTEAMKAMIDFLFKKGVHKVVSSYIVGNDASKRVMEKCGMIFEGYRKDDVYYHDKYHDLGYYYIINDNHA